MKQQTRTVVGLHSGLAQRPVGRMKQGALHNVGARQYQWRATESMCNIDTKRSDKRFEALQM